MKFKIEQVRFDQVDAWGEKFEVYLCGDRKQQFGGVEYGLLTLFGGTWVLQTSCSVEEQIARNPLVDNYGEDRNQAFDAITKELLGKTYDEFKIRGIEVRNLTGDTIEIRVYEDSDAVGNGDLYGKLTQWGPTRKEWLLVTNMQELGGFRYKRYSGNAHKVTEEITDKLFGQIYRKVGGKL